MQAPHRRLRPVTAVASLAAAWLTLVATASQAAPPPPGPKPGDPATPVAPADTAVVELVEVSDLQCPFCARVQPTLADLRAKYGSRLMLRWVHNPLPFHQNARPAALAVEAARNQGKLDAMVAELYLNQQDLSRAAFEAAATKLGLDLTRFQKDLDDPATAAVVDRDQRIANAVDARGTPTFFINGKQLKGAQPVEEFLKLIEEELALAGSNAGQAWRESRLAANNQDLFNYLVKKDTPPEIPKTTPSPDLTATLWKVSVDVKSDGLIGPTYAPVTLVVFDDYQCPFCRKLEPGLTSLREKYGDDLRIVVKHNPLPFHKDAEPAARAAICAQAQGKFAAMHAALFATEAEALGDDTYRALAKQIGLKGPAFDKCMKDAKTKKHIDADIDLAGLVTARGTPNSFVNGRKILGAKPIEEFVTLIDKELAAAKAKLATGIALPKIYDSIIADGQVQEALESKVQPIDTSNAPRLGKAKAKVNVAFFGDLQCPFSARAFPMLADLVKAYPGTVSVTFHHYPLSFHKDAATAAAAAVCADEQGKFWEFAGAVYENQQGLPESIDQAIDDLALDRQKIDACLASERPAALVQKHMDNGKASELKGTPTFYIQGRKFNSSKGYNVEALSEVIDKYYPAARKP